MWNTLTLSFYCTGKLRLYRLVFFLCDYKAAASQTATCCISAGVVIGEGSFRLQWKCNKNLPLLQKMPKILLSWLNALNVSAEHVAINFVEFFPGNCWNLAADVF